MQKYTIVFSSNDNYARCLGVAIASILKNSDEDESFAFNILDGGITQKNKQKITALKKIKNFDLKFVQIDKRRFRDFPLDYTQKSLAVYFRLCIPSLFPDVDKLLYLDCDVVTVQSLRELFKTDIRNYYGAAVPDILAKRWAADIKIPAKQYFNSGVLLINCKKWRTDKIEQKAFRYLLEHKSTHRLHDQPVLNALFAGKIRFINERFNLQYHPSYGRSRGADYSKMRKAIKSPVIIHFSSPDKPWIFFSRHPLRREYFKYLKFTPWRKEKYLWCEQIQALLRPWKMFCYRFLRKKIL